MFRLVREPAHGTPQPRLPTRPLGARGLKGLGVRILAVYPPCLQGEVYEKHSDRRRTSTNANDISSVNLTQFSHGGMLYLLGPYGGVMIDVLQEILTRFPEVDAFRFSGLHDGGCCCYWSDC